VYGNNPENRDFQNDEKLAIALAHEINNPLQSLMDLLYLLRTEPTLTERAHRYLTLACEEAQRISLLTREVMNQLPEQAALKLTSNVPQVLSGVVDFYRSRFESQGISIRSRYCKDGDLAIEAGLLRQMFTNLLLNAADALPDGGKIQARVAVTREWGGLKRNGLRITFADNGSGISVENLPLILQPFFTTKGQAGTGIGLSLVSTTLRKYQGVLRVRSTTRAGRSGSVFAIFLPVA
jgi:signal transduction histidine kinase